uniref:Uncharacterized protein n=1 Tax=Colobus angolensis palliatus TaxID=336983 RepID=A0A2K5J9U9_COLAP
MQEQEMKFKSLGIPYKALDCLVSAIVWPQALSWSPLDSMLWLRSHTFAVAGLLCEIPSSLFPPSLC